MGTLPVRILVVDDFEPFRRFVCSTLTGRPDLQVISEASDGREAVQKAQDLQPDLVVLDIGLPNLNGVGAARQIRTLCPQSKIVFLSQESSAEVVQEALDLGAVGYVVKTDAGTELLAAVDAARQNRQFVSRGLSWHHHHHATNIEAAESNRDRALPSLAPGRSGALGSHKLEFYSGDAALVVGFSAFIETALNAGNAAIVVATESHRESLLRTLQEHGVDIAAARERGRYFALDAGHIISAFMRNDLPDPVLFRGVLGELIAAAGRGSAGPPSRVAICGECSSILWAQGKADAAIQVERLCNQVTEQDQLDILCGLPLSTFERVEDRQIFEKILPTS
ncbi:MAG TPA: response regulator [Candidatus Sulfotelmatobacter sp.]